ncbi:MAG: DUF429 domain-containing protein [Actinomycetota bacterium]|nr:DUF429 domain-containing protein [Actinomycetota bacterium]
MRTVGVDLAAEARATAVAEVVWHDDGRATLETLLLGADDEAVLEALSRAERAAVDCPLGWPEPFAAFLQSHRMGQVQPPAGLSGLQWRRTLSRRTTDLVCEAVTGVRPLSVSADRIAAVAMRGAGLLGALAARGQPVDRAGDGRVVECYPAAALRTWGLPHQAYKRAVGAEALGRLTTAVQQHLPGLRLGEHEALVRSSDDAFDAVVCALVARAAALGVVAGPQDNDRQAAAVEGWIVLPTGPLANLLPAAPEPGRATA